MLKIIRPKKTVTKLEEESCKATVKSQRGMNRSTPHLLAEHLEPKYHHGFLCVLKYQLLERCTVCGIVKQKGDRQKFRICEDVCAQKLLEAAVFFQDEVYYRTSDLQDVHSVSGSELYCHKTCIRIIILAGMTGQKVNVMRHQIAQRKIGVLQSCWRRLNLH